MRYFIYWFSALGAGVLGGLMLLILHLDNTKQQQFLVMIEEIKDLRSEMKEIRKEHEQFRLEVNQKFAEVNQQLFEIRFLLDKKIK